jgi:hypothetical protein
VEISLKVHGHYTDDRARHYLDLCRLFAQNLAQT